MSRVTRSQARRRRVGGTFFVVLLVALGSLLAMARSDDPVVDGRRAGHSDTALSSPRPAPVPAWLAWMPGGFPEGFRRQVAALPDLTDTVVVAGDTRWMTASHDAKGALVDRPDPPYEIPIDAFSVDPGDYAGFLPMADREQVVSSLRDGKAVLGSTSAHLRGIGVGGSISFGDLTIDVGAVAPDEAVGWSEMLVSREVGVRLGIAHDRYLLATAGNGMTSSSFHDLIAGLIPPDTPLRTVAPGDTPYVRVASGVNPPVVMKEVFGEFSAYPQSDDPSALNMSPAWYDAHIDTRSVPLLGEVTCNKALFPALVGALQQVRDDGLGSEIHVYSGCYAPRTVARSDTAPPSQHAWGAAIDINAPENPYGSTPTMDHRIVKIFEHWGFNWGGDFLIPDGMHFEYGSPAPAGG
jgi:D-alanyl-D-alanine carboxypeptidase